MSRRDPLADFPPITVVTTSVSSVGTSSRRSTPKSNAPIILMKPSSTSTQSQSQSQSNRDSEQPFSISIATRPEDNTYAPTGSIAIVNKNINHTDDTETKIHNDKQVDSALLSALRDKRERMALLRLEKNLIEFMNDKNCGFMEVGGAGNSVVIRGASGGSASLGSVLASNSPDADNENGNGVTMRGPMSTNGATGYNNGNDGQGRQTSFQRLCLHRLADRFNIVREQGYNNPNNYMNNNPALIRLVKVKESRIPSLKLIDVDLSQYDQSPPQDRGDGYGGVGVMGIADRLTMTQLQDGATGGKKKSKKKEKVKIMKRSTSNNQVGGDQKGKSNSSKRKGKKLSEKEKAYAEARARIFNSAESIPNVDGSDHAASFANTSAHSSNVGDSSPGSRDRSANTSPVPVTGTIASPVEGGSRSETLVPSQVTNATLGTSVQNEGKSNRLNLPAAATGGGTSKVTWRNREQEASDPDFQRRHHPIMIQPMPMHPQYHLYSQNGMMGNGYGQHLHANTAGGYHYGVAAGEGQMYSNHGHHDVGLGVYAAATSNYQANGSWQQQPSSYDPRFQQQSQHEFYKMPSTEGGKLNQDHHVAKTDIDLSGEEFPALR